MDRFKPRHGTPAPYHRHMAYIADSAQQAFRDAFADYLALAQDFFVSGCTITGTPSGTSTNYSITAGAACFQGEFLRVDPHSVIKTSSQVVYLEVYEDAVDLFPVLNADGSSDNVMIRRRLRLAVGPVYPTDHMAITAPRKEALDRLRLRGRIVLPGMIVPYFGPVDHFGATGLGLAGTPMDGWAVCNGLNGTPDLRGMALIGATQVPASGAPVPYSGVHPTPSSPGDKVGADRLLLESDQLPEHTHPITWPSAKYPAALMSGSAQFEAGSGHPYLDFPVETDANATAHDPVEVRQSSFALIYVMSIVA